jgi:hypothetical protein
MRCELLFYILILTCEGMIELSIYLSFDLFFAWSRRRLYWGPLIRVKDHASFRRVKEILENLIKSSLLLLMFLRMTSMATSQWNEDTKVNILKDKSLAL